LTALDNFSFIAAECSTKSVGRKHFVVDTFLGGM
jgi:hypothetical protein